MPGAGPADMSRVGEGGGSGGGGGAEQGHRLGRPRAIQRVQLRRGPARRSERGPKHSVFRPPQHRCRARRAAEACAAA